MKQPTIAAALIVKGSDDEAPLLADCLSSIAGQVDAIYIDVNAPEGQKASDKVLKVARQYTKHVRETVWEDNFVKARNASFGQVQEDWIIWLDSDDKIDQPQMLRRVIAVQPERVDGIYIEYDYAHDEWGNTTVSHWVARIVRNNNSYIWKSSIGDETVSVHETLTERRPGGKSRNDEFKVVHQSTPSRMDASLVRNTHLLERMLQAHKDQNEIDPRILFYLATHYFDGFRYAEARQLFAEYIQLSGWDEERCEAHVYLGRLLMLEGKLRQARTAFLMAVGENVASPRPFIELGQLEYNAKRYQQSVWWLEIALDRPAPTTTMVQAPMENLFRAHLLLAQSLVNLGGPALERAVKEVELALKLRPTEPDAKRAQELIFELIRERDDMKAAVRMTKILKDEDDESVQSFLAMLPPELRSSPPMIQASQAINKPKKWPSKSLVIYCPPGPLGTWGPWRLEEGGISGSEEAVIQLTKHMAALGWEVVVYGTPGHREGVYDGVQWRNYYELNPKDEFDVLVAWRSPWMFDQEWTARRKYLWMHDVMDEAELDPKRIERLDSVIFVSQYHASFYPWIPEDKVFISGNGIDPKSFLGLGDRTKHRMVYMSDHVRGLRLLYEAWPKIRKAVPDATLDVYYGWEGFDSVHRDNPERMAWKDQMVKWVTKLPGVTDHGRIDHKQVVEELANAEILAYPCIFPEVYSITYAKAAAAGCQPVTSDYGVLGDYSDIPGVKQVHFDSVPTEKQIESYSKVLIDALKHPLDDETREQMMIQAFKRFSWSGTANQWDSEFSERTKTVSQP